MLIRLAITAIILAILAMGIDMGESARAIAAIDLRYLALVLGLVAIDRMVMILRWVLLLRASGIAITTRDAGMPMCRRMSGSTPWPMLPKPTITMRPGKSTYTLWFMFLSTFSTLKPVPAGWQRALETRQRLDAP